MGLSAREKAGSRRLLELLDTTDLLSLAGTVTKKKSTASTRAGAIDTILQYSQSAYELLNRRKVFRDTIAAYLKNEGIPIPAKITKPEVVQKTLTFWSDVDTCIPTAVNFVPSSITQQQKASASDISHQFYFHTPILSARSPQEDAIKTWSLRAMRSDLDEIISGMNFIPARDPVISFSITKQEKVSDVSLKVLSKVSCSSHFYDNSELSTHSCQRDDQKEQKSTSQTQDPQYDLNHSVSSSQSSTCPFQVVDEGYTVTKGEKGKPQKSQSSLVSETVPHMKTRSMFQTEQHNANFEVKIENAEATPCTGVTQNNKKVSQPLTPLQSVHDKRNTKEVVTSPSTTKTVTHMKTTSMLQTGQQYAATKQTENMAPIPCTDVTQNNKKVSQPLTAHDKRNTKEVVTSPSTTKEADDPACIWPVDCEKFAKDFCEWFYPLLNSQYPSSGLQNKDWGPQHFLEDAALHLTYMSAKRQYNGGRKASSRLLALILEDKLIFQPNITNRGVKCERSPKGMVVALAGTISRNKSYVGTFDQVFKIVGNTRDNNWKIQYVDLKILKSS